MNKRIWALAPLVLAPFLVCQEIPFQPGHGRAILAARFSPDDDQLISFSAADERLCLWDVRTGRLLWMAATGFVQDRYEYANLIEFLWSEDRRTIMTESLNGTCQIWDAKTGKIVAHGGKEDIRRLLTSESDWRALSGTPATGAVRERFGRSHGTAREAATDLGWESSIRITDYSANRSWRLEAHPGAVKELTYSPDGSVLAVAGTDSAVYLFAAATRTLVRTLAGHVKPVFFLAFGPDGKTLLACDENMTAKLWDWRTGKVIREAELGGDSFGEPHIALSPDGRTFLVAGEDQGITIGLWKTASLKPLRKIRIKGQYRKRAGISTSVTESVPVVDAVFLGDGDRVLAAYEDGSLCLWDAFRGRPIERFDSGRKISRLIPGPDDRTIFMIEGDWKVQRVTPFDLEIRRALASLDEWETDHIEEIAFSPDGRHVAASHDESDVMIGTRRDSRRVRRLDVGRSGFDALAFSPDGKALAVGGANQNVMIFDVETGTKVWQLLPLYQPSALEAKLSGERSVRQAAADEIVARRNRQAEVDTKKYQEAVGVDFDHYGVMADPMYTRFGETGDPEMSKIVMPAEDAEAVWLRLRNDSPLPIKLEAHSMYMKASRCVHEFSKGNRLTGLCPGSEVSLRLEVEDRSGRSIPSVIDHFFIVYALPNTSVLFAVPKTLWDEEAAFTLRYTFQNAIEANVYWAQTGNVADYGAEQALRFARRDGR